MATAPVQILSGENIGFQCLGEQYSRVHSWDASFHCQNAVVLTAPSPIVGAFSMLELMCVNMIV